MKAKMRISATTVEGLESILNEYLFSRHYKINLETLKVENPHMKQEHLDRWQVRINKGRYYIYELLKD